MHELDEEKNYFALDLGNSSLKVAQLRELHGKPTLVTYGDMDIPENILASDSQIDQEKVARYLSQLVSESGITSKNVIAALPSSSSYSAIIKTPKLSEKELGESITYQADKYIPMPIDKVKLDWVVVGEDVENEELSVLIVAAPNSLANKYLNIVQKAGFELLALEMNSIALSRSLLGGVGTNSVSIVVDLGTIATDITMYKGQIPELVRSVSFGSKAFRRVVGQNLGIDETQADEYMKKFGLLKDKLDGVVYKTLKPVVDHIIDEIKKSIQFYADKNPDSKVDKIILTGGTSALPGLPAHIANEAQITVEIGNPWRNIAYPPELKENLAVISLNYAVVLGLALRNY